MRNDPEFIRTASTMEAWGWAGINIILYDGERLTDAGREQIKAMQDHLGDDPSETISVPAAWLKDLFVQTPTDKLEQYMKGFPILVSGVARENHDDNPKHRPPDHEIVKTAKEALRIETFRLMGRQIGVEIARNTRARQLTEAEAKSRAMQTIAKAVWRGGPDAPSKKIVSHFNGLIDRGRRLAARFFNVAQPHSLHQNSHLPLIAQGVLSGRDRSLPSNSDWNNHSGKQNEVTDRNNN